MKNKGVIISILFILCFGALVTVRIRRFVTVDTAESPASEAYRESMLPAFGTEPLPDGVSGEAGAPVSPEQKAADAPEAAAVKLQVAAAADEMPPDAPPDAVPEELSAPAGPVPETKAVPTEAAAAADGQPGGKSVLISPLTGSQETGENTQTTVLKREDYEKKLQDLDVRIQKMKDSGVEPSTDSYKNMADYEYRSWDSELNTIYQALIRCMTEEEKEALRLDERAWMKQRDLTARKAISKYNGGTIESLEYTVSLADSTRTRAYELLEEYGGYLDGAAAETDGTEESETG